MREGLRAHDAATTLRAGGVAPLDGCPTDKDAPGTASARAYRHPALPGQVVVRLEADLIAGAADAEMEALGFGVAQVSAPLGRMRHRTIGFPGWAILHDPAHARFALAVTREFKKAAKRARSKPGHAKDDFDAIAARLAKSVPHFLPSFWEEVGRVFLAHDAVSFAAQAFERARQAEKEFGLAVDEPARAASFLEFALAGALSAKSLGAYARDLQIAVGAAEAHQRYRELCLGRTRGGMPPWAGLGRELRQLAKAAGLEPQVEDERFFADAIGPALVRAPAEFWKTYRAAAAAVARRDPAARRFLLDAFPSHGARWRGVSAESAQAHFDLLEECGALGALADAPVEELPAGGLAAWTGRALEYLGTCARSRELLVRLAPRLRAAGEPIAVHVRSGWRRRLSLDLAELALEHGLSVALTPGQPAEFELDGSTCDPVRTAADPVLGRLLVAAVGAGFGTPAFEALARGKAGLLAARRAWLEGQIEALEHGLIEDADEAVVAIERRTSPVTFGDLPGTHARLAAVNWSAVLARTLCAGLVEELAWPAYEAACAELGADVVIDGAFPHLVLRSATRAIVLGAAGRELTHDLAYDPRAETLQHALYLDGALLVCVVDRKTHQRHAYWSTEPRNRFAFPTYLHAWGGEFPVSTDLPAGGTTLGYAAIRAGDTRMEGYRSHMSDGQAVWVYVYEPGKHDLRELDPATGKVGRASRPTFLEGHAPAVTRGRSPGWVLPAPRGLTRSALGSKDGVLGMRAKLDRDNLVIENIDGTRETVPAALLARSPYALLRFPGHQAPHLLVRLTSAAARGLARVAAVFTTSGRCVAAAGGDGWSGKGWGGPVPPAEFWHFVETRDVASSEALRRCPDGAAAELLAAAREVGEEQPRNAPLPRTTERAGALVPHAVLQRAVAVAAAKTALLQARLGRVLARGETAARAPAPPGPARALQAMLDALREPGAVADMPPAEWVEWLTHPRARALLLDSPLVSESQRSEQLDFVETLLASAGELARMRVLQCGRPRVQVTIAARPGAGVKAWAAGASTYVSRSSWQASEVVERSATGQFVTPPDLQVVEEVRPGAESLAWLAQWLAAARAGPCVRWEPELATRLATAATLTRAEAALLWVGAPGVGSYVKDFLGTEARAALGLKVAEADSARGTFKAMPRETMLGVLDAALGEPGGSPEERVGAAWRARFGARLQVPEDVVLACDKELGAPVPAVELFRTYLDPAASPLLKKGKLDNQVITAGGMLIPYLALSTRAGDALALAAPAFHAALVAALDDPQLILPLGVYYPLGPGKPTVDQMMDAIGGAPTKLGPGADPKCTRALDGGLLLAGRTAHSVLISFRPAQVRAESLGTLRPLAGEHAPAWRGVAAIVFLRSAACRAMVARLGGSPLAAGAWDANPAASAPGVVERAAQALALGADAAALYLQLLALAEPTARAVQRWNGWTADRYRKACAALVAQKLVLEGKRERAGREVFLPGEWVKGAGKELPTEGWKLALYRGPGATLPRRLPLEPLPALFESAWRRVESGDVPKFEEVS